MTHKPPLPVEIEHQAIADAWTGLEDFDGICREAIEAAIRVLPADQLGVPGPLEVSVYFADNSVSQNLNLSHRGKNSPTNVLSFPQPKPAVPTTWTLGDIVLAGETVASEAKKAKTSLSDHTIHLIMHGFLHLLGYDHQDEDDAAQMEALEIAAMAELGLANPYKLDDR